MAKNKTEAATGKTALLKRLLEQFGYRIDDGLVAAYHLGAREALEKAASIVGTLHHSDGDEEAAEQCYLAKAIRSLLSEHAKEK